MTDSFDFPGRPKHPDFMQLAAIVLRNDGAATEGGKSLPEILEPIIDSESVIYMAKQRMGKLFGLDPEDPQLARAVSIWLDAFTAGAMFAQREEK